MRIVITDANVLINLATAGGLRLLGKLPGHEFVVAEDVRAEVMDAEQQLAVDEAIRSGALGVVRLESPEGIKLFADLRRVMGPGEAACIALANTHGWTVASDEKRAFRREALRLLGEHRLLTTVDIYLMSIRAGCITVAEADAAKDLLAARRFAVKFASFAELLKG